MENKELKSNEYYSLSELFSDRNRRIIIPDFQRDYCWGDKTHGEKHDTAIVYNFLDTLIDEFTSDKNSDLLLGKIDVYEHPKNHIYLTDGQQRLTTLYLLIGMLYRKEEDVKTQNDLKKCLISDFEKKIEDKEPYLQYSIRGSTVFFLRDLVNEFYIKKKSLKVLEIKNQPWYFNDYNLDPSIISMLSTLRVIENKLKEFKDGFSDFIIHNIKIQYYDVKDKQHGEERFVIINTTGKSLTVSENIKPILLGNTDSEFAKKWEERETWFWKNRKEDENIADHGVNDFLTWCFQIIDIQDEIAITKKGKELLKNKTNEKYLEQINKIYCSLKQLLILLEEDKFQALIMFINDNKRVENNVNLRNLSKPKQQNILLPLLAFITKFKTDKDGIYQFLRRLRKNYYDNQWDHRKNNYLDWRYVLQIIENTNTIEQVLRYETTNNTISKIQKVPLNHWFNEEEKYKVQLSQHQQIIEKWEDHKDFMGDLTILFQSYLIRSDDREIPKLKDSLDFDIEELKKKYSNYQKTIDLIRSQEKAKNDKSLANMFRLFRLFIGCNKVGHIYRTSSDFEGVLFSTLNREHFFQIDFIKLLTAEKPLDFCTTLVKKMAKEQNIFDFTDFTTNKFIKSWLTLKVFYANSKNELLEFNDGKNTTGIAVYLDKDLNKLIDTEEFSLANSICGFGVRSGFGNVSYVRYTQSCDWLQPNIIDTPFSDVAYYKKERLTKELLANEKTINKIIQAIHLD